MYFAVIIHFRSWKAEVATFTGKVKNRLTSTFQVLFKKKNAQKKLTWGLGSLEKYITQAASLKRSASGQGGVHPQKKKQKQSKLSFY